MNKLLFLATLVLTSSPAFSAAIATDGTYYEFGFAGVGSSGTACAGCTPTNPASDPTVDPPWTFSGPGTLFVLDLFLSVDQFDLYDFGVLLGTTSVPTSGGGCGNDIACAILDAQYSRGTFLLGGGNHSLTIVQTAGQTGAAVFSVNAGEVPEPSSYALLGLGLAALLGRKHLLRR
ncbi:MAG: PEP-CTERM sorting domain-containing protein [Acidobacteriota bacterium]